MGLITSTGNFPCMHHWGALSVKPKKIRESKIRTVTDLKTPHQSKIGFLLVLLFFVLTSSIANAQCPTNYQCTTIDGKLAVTFQFDAGNTAADQNVACDFVVRHGGSLSSGNVENCTGGFIVINGIRYDFIGDDSGNTGNNSPITLTYASQVTGDCPSNYQIAEAIGCGQTSDNGCLTAIFQDPITGQNCTSSNSYFSITLKDIGGCGPYTLTQSGNSQLVFGTNSYTTGTYTTQTIKAGIYILVFKDANGNESNIIYNHVTENGTCVTPSNLFINKIITSGDPYSDVGDIINYQYTVTSDVSITSPVVFDDRIGTLTTYTGDTNMNSILESTETWIFTGMYTITQADIDAGSVTNNAFARGKTSLGQDIFSDVDDATATLRPCDVPAAPVVEVTNPDCGETTGSVIITSSTTGLVFSLNGAAYAAYPVGGYIDLVPGDYTLVAKSTGEGECISATTEFDIDEPLLVPAAPVVEVTNPDCGETTGSVIITSSTTGLVFSLNGAAYAAYPVGGYIDLVPGDYTLVAKSTGEGECISATTEFDIDEPLLVPAAPVVEVTNPDCGETTGSVIITSSTTGLVFSLNGAAYAAYPVGGYIDLVPGDYTLVAKSTGEGECISATTEFDIDEPLLVPAAPVVEVTNPDCGETTGSVIITSSTTGLVFSLNGAAYAAYPVGGYIDLVPGDYTLVAKSTGEGECISATTEFDIDEPLLVPAAPVVEVTNPDCGETTGSVIITSSTTGLVFSLNGAAYAAYPVGGYIDLVPGDYTLVAKSTGEGECISATTEFDIDEPLLVPAAPVVEVTNPDCGETTGSVIITSSTTGLVFSLNGAAYAAYPVGGYIDLVPGDYTLVAKSTGEGECISATTEFDIDEPLLVPAAPVVEVTNPDCGETTGSVIITSSTTGLVFSLNGAAYAAYPVGGYIDLVPGDYTLVAKSTGEGECISATTEFDIDEPLLVPAAPVVEVTNPDCGETTGSVIITSSTTGLVFSLNGAAYAAYPVGGYIDLVPGDYTLVAKSTGEGECISATTEFDIDEPLLVPAAPVVEVTNPDCGETTGSVIITSSTTGLVFSLNGAAYAAYPVGGYIDLVPGDYTLVAKSTGEGECISATTEFDIDEPLLVPAAPVVEVTNPDCGETTGSVIITSSTTGLVFSLNGAAYAAYPVGGYIDLVPGDYTLVAKSTGEGECISATTEFDIDEPLLVPAAPVVEVTNPDCGETTGSVIITSSTTGLVFSLNGAAYAAYPVGGYIDLVPGDYTLVAKSTGEGECISATTEFDIDEPLLVPAAPVVEVTNPDCGETTGSVIITSSTTGLVFSLNGAAYAAYPVGGYIDLVPGDYTLVAKSTGEGECISATTEFDIDEPLLVPAAPVVEVTNPDCGETTGSVIITSSTTGLVFSLNGAAYAAYPVGGYIDLVPGDYTLVAKSTGEGECISATTEFDIDEPLLVPAAPVVEVTNPDCGETTGSVIITSSTTGLVFSLNGAAYAAYPVGGYIDLVPGDYTLVAKSTGEGECISATTEFDIDEPLLVPAAPVVEVTNPDCGETTGSVIITSSTTGLVFSLNGAAYAAYPVGGYIDLVPGDYTLVAKSTGEGECISATTEFDIDEPLLVPAAPVVEVTNPDCGETTGSVIITSSTTGLVFSLNGAAYAAYPVGGYIDLVPGDYTLVAKSTGEGECISATTEFDIDEPLLVPAAPVVEVTNPDCGETTGSVIITSSTTGLVFSLNGAAYAAYPVGGYIDLVPGDYTLVAKSTGEGECISATTEFDIDEPLLVPAAPVVEVTNPDCGETTGSVIITSSTTGLVFSLNGAAYAAYPVGGYIDLVPGDYTLVAKSTGEGECISATTEFDIDEPLLVPAAPVVEVTNPDCGETTGSVIITSSTTGLVFSLNGAAYAAYPVGGYIDLVPGDYTLVAKSTGEGECISATTEFDIDEPLLVPAAPVVEVTNPDCGETTGSVIITSSTTGLVFSLNGAAYAAYPVGGYIDLVPGDYTLVAKSTGEGECISATTEFDIDEPLLVPAAPVVEVTNPDCGETTGSVIITSSTTGLVFSLNGAAYAAYPVGGYIDLVPGDYTLVAKSTGEGECISATTEFDIDEPLLVPAAPVVEVTNPDCGETTGSVIITSSTTGLVFSLNGAAYAAYPVGGYIDLVPGDYTLVAKSTGEGECISATTEFDIDEPLLVPAAPVVEVTNPDCGETTGSVIITSSTTGLVFSLNGAAYAAYPVGGYIDLVPGDYTLVAKSTGEGECISATTEFDIDEPLLVPAAPVVEVTNPDCGETTGSVIITSSTTGLVFSLNGAAYAAYPVGGYIDLVPGDYTLVAKSTGEGECISATTEFDIDEPLLVPAAPVVEVTNPDCGETTGSVIITSSTTGLVFSLNGAAYAAYPVGGYIDLVPGDYTLVAKSTGEGECISATTEFDIDEPFDVPANPILEAIQPTCDILTGTVLVTSPTQDLFFSLDGAAFISYPVEGFAGLNPGNYTIQVRSGDNCTSGMASITLYAAENCIVAEGCTLGYWKNHTDRWCVEYQTCTLYGDVFENAPGKLAELTLLEVLNLGGGGVFNLGRQSVAALLNACSDEVDYDLETTAEVIAYVNANFNNAGAAGSYLDELNNAGCPLGGTQATSAPSEECDPDDSDTGNNGKPGKGNNKASVSGFSAYPVPFKETLNIQYEFDYVSPATIQFFDMRGRLLRSVKELKATRGVVTTIDIDYSMRPSQTYIVKITTDREVITKQIISSK